MKKQDLANVVVDITGGTKVQGEEIVNTLFDKITDSLKSGNDVEIAGFGKFVVADRAAREARNPRTGETIQVAARRVAKFKPAKALKDAVM